MILVLFLVRVTTAVPLRGKGRGKHRPGKGARDDPGPPRQRDDRARDARGGRRDDRRHHPRHDEPTERCGSGRDERRGRDALTTVAIATVTDVGTTDVISRTPRRLVDLQLATAAETVMEIAVETMEVTEVTTMAVGETTHPGTGKNLGPGGRPEPQPSPALEGQGRRARRRRLCWIFHPFEHRCCG